MTCEGEFEPLIFRSLLEKEQNNVSDFEKKHDIFPGNTMFFDERNHVLPCGKDYEYLSENIYYRFIKLHKCIKKKTMLKMPDGFVQLVFCIQGRYRYLLQSGAVPLLNIEGQQHNLVYFGKHEAALCIDSEDALEVAVFYIKQDYFLKYALPHFPELDAFLQKISNNEASVLSAVNLCLNYKIALVLHQLLEEKVHPSIKFHFVEAKVVELLMLQWSLLVKQEETAPPLILKEEEVQKMHLAKDFLIRKMLDKFTLKDLAHEVGTNEYHLKRHFKIVHGQTVFGFLHSYKMNMAKASLIDPHIKISHLSEKLGYKHATHFSAAFKKFFGHLPRESRE